LSVSVQVIAWKDSVLKWLLLCREGCETLLTYVFGYNWDL